ncbi:MAG: aminotransferase class I/II-fold pyridoxal phosphate-dependent enzyme [Spirochaetes bacterium]|nr:aminotransferase class I/II-fold pyridoxal phosphate-dependent enzyme [Spirochaetota bacterium]MBN2769263.1 aminotransferase class I/II-fold pyridoxal phosphate-dependent enzyme [Spirochaetota bacterium]
MENLSVLQKQYEDLIAEGLNLNIERGQPADENFDIANPMLTIVDDNDLVTPSNISIRNYPGGPAGIPEIREICSELLGIKPEETIVGNNSSLAMLVNTLMWALIKGVNSSSSPWITQKPKIIVTVPGYDRHFTLLEALGFEIITVPMEGDGPSVEKIEQLASSDSSVKGLIFVPTYSNPTGETISDDKLTHLAEMKTAADDFTIFADDAYTVHHLSDEYDEAKNIIRACEEAGNPNRAYIFGSTSKITFSGAGIGFMGSSIDNINYTCKLLSAQSIGPNKVEQYRHYKFFKQFPGGVEGLMLKHAQILKPKFDAAQKVLNEELGDKNLAEWTNPNGGYFISLDTKYPVAKRVVELCKKAGVALTPAGATFPQGNDPKNSNIRIAPTRPSVEDVTKAMKVLCACIKLASAEHLEN